ncbi:hypothetical protein ABH931_005714 [Streptacidiphilus sp. MAP12-33]
MRGPWKHRRPAVGTGRRKPIGLALLLCVAATVGALWVFSATRHANPPLKVADVSGRPTACLASDSNPSNGATVTHLWSLMRHAVSGERVNAQQIQVPIPRGENAGPYLAGLVNQHCDLVVTVGKPFGQAIDNMPRSPGKAQFIAVDSGLARPGSSQLTLVSTNAAQKAIQVAISKLTASE